jgi:hypothetical protein
MPSSRVPGGAADDGATAGPGARQVVRRIGYAAIALVAAVTLGLSVNHALRATADVENPSWTRAATAAYRQEECIYRAIRTQLPQGATVYISAPASSWRNAPRLVELSTLWAVPQPTAATAQWTLTLVPEPGHCLGLALQARRR